MDSHPAILLQDARGSWKRGSLQNAVDKFTLLLNHGGASTQEKLTAVHTVINDCYNPEQKEAVAKILDPIYTFLQNTTISYASVRDILSTIFRIRNVVLQETNTVVFKEHMDLWTSSIEQYTAGSHGMTFYVIHKAYQWVCDAIEFARPAGKETLWTYLTTWISDPQFHTDLPIREKCKYQFFACEFLLQSYRLAEQRIATDFLLTVAESEEYSTFIRGDALDVLLRNPVPQEYRNRIGTIHERLRVIREDTIANQRMQAIELGNRQAAVLQAIAVEPYVPQFAPAIAGTVYNDSQNVHATAVNDAIKDSLINMSKDDEIRGNTVYKVADDIAGMIESLPHNRCTDDQRTRAKAALKRYIEDPAVFTDKRIKLGAVLVMVWNRMTRHEEFSEMCMRLTEELAEAFNTCATGHLSRVVSVLVGYYPDIKQFSSFESQLENNIIARINAMVRKAPEELQGDLLIAMADNKCEEYQVYLSFLKSIHESVYKELHSEFVPGYMSEETFDRIFSKNWPSEDQMV